MNFDEKLRELVKRHARLGESLSGGGMDGKEFAKVSKEYSDLGQIVERVNAYFLVKDAYVEAEEMLKDATLDAEMKALAEEEFYLAKEKLPQVEKDIQIALLPKDEADAKNAILEVRAGTGGEEAALFASDLFIMYQRYSERRGWKFEIMSISDADAGGYKEATAAITGANVFERLKFESGVHRVQRVPKTETQGRIHTSAATVAVLPEAEEVDIVMDEKDLKIDVYRSSGPGGQSVNTTDSAVRITHIPTGVVVIQQDEKSQHKNKAKALKILRSRLYDAERAKKDAERSANRKSQIGSGDRSERIRTYNYPQSRVSDHRINLTLHNLDLFVRTGDMDDMVEALITQDQADKLSEAV